MYSAFNPWDRITTVEQLQQLMQNSGVAAAEIVPESGSQILQSSEDWWTVVLGSGMRWTIDAMDSATATRVREQTVGWARDNGVTAIQTNVIYAVATKE